MHATLCSEGHFQSMGGNDGGNDGGEGDGGEGDGGGGLGDGGGGEGDGGEGDGGGSENFSWRNFTVRRPPLNPWFVSVRTLRYLLGAVGVHSVVVWSSGNVLVPPFCQLLWLSVATFVHGPKFASPV